MGRNRVDGEDSNLLYGRNDWGMVSLCFLFLFNPFHYSLFYFHKFPSYAILAVMSVDQAFQIDLFLLLLKLFYLLPKEQKI